MATSTTTNHPSEVGVIMKILLDCEGHELKLETVHKTMISGKLEKAEENMNCMLSAVTVTKKDGTTIKKDSLFIKGTNIKMIFLPKAAEGLCEFKMTERRLKSSTGRGKRDILQAQAAARFENRPGPSHHRTPQRSSSQGRRDVHEHREHHGHRHHSHHHGHQHSHHHGHHSHRSCQHHRHDRSSSPPSSHRRYWDQ